LFFSAWSSFEVLSGKKKITNAKRNMMAATIKNFGIITLDFISVYLKVKLDFHIKNIF